MRYRLRIPEQELEFDLEPIEDAEAEALELVVAGGESGAPLRYQVRVEGTVQKFEDSQRGISINERDAVQVEAPGVLVIDGVVAGGKDGYLVGGALRRVLGEPGVVATLDGAEVAVGPFPDIEPVPREPADFHLGNADALRLHLGDATPARPGDRLWLAGGTYSGRFESVVSGAEGAPVVVRPEPGQRATIDGSLSIGGDWSEFYELEILSSDAHRTSAEAGSFPKDIRIATGCDLNGSHSKLVNSVVHDIVGNGVGIWRKAVGSEVYGCLIYNNGWKAPDRGHGHGIYQQSESPADPQRILNNLVWQNLGGGIDPHGSGTMRGFLISGNIVFRNTLNLGFYDTLHDCLVIDNRVEGAIRTLFYKWVTGTVLRGNYVTENLQLDLGADAVVELNIARGAKVQLGAPLSEAYRFDRNLYRGGPLSLSDVDGELGVGGFEDWQALGLDPKGLYLGPFAEVDVFVHPNDYAPGRAHVAVFNWPRHASVEVDLAEVLEPGQAFEIRDAQNYFGGPVAVGEYDGPIALPLELSERSLRNGLGTPAHTGAEFGAFVVIGN